MTEVSLMPNLTSQKPHRFTYIWIQKSWFTTFDILEQLKNFFKLSFEDVANQGLKDEDAVTEQLISIKKVLKDKDVIAFNKKYKSRKSFVTIKHIVGYGNEAIKERMLHGNLFRIVVRNLDNTIAENLLNYISNHRHHYFIYIFRQLIRFYVQVSVMQTGMNSSHKNLQLKIKRTSEILLLPPRYMLMT